MHPLSIAEASIAAEWVVALLFGINVGLFVDCSRVLIKRRNNGSKNASWLLVIAVLQLLISAGHSASLLCGVLVAFRRSANSNDTMAMHLADMGSGWHIAQQAFFIANEAIGSAVLVWRCYMVWERNWRLALPLALTCIATPLAGIGGTIKMMQLSPDITSEGSLDVFFSQVKPWLAPYGLLSITTQVTATSLIAWKAWLILSASTVERSSGAEWFAVRVMLESGALCSGLTVIGVAFILADSAAGHLLAGMLGQINATSPYLMIIRSDSWKDKSTDEDSSPVLSDGPFDILISQHSVASDLVHRRTRRHNATNGTELTLPIEAF